MKKLLLLSFLLLFIGIGYKITSPLSFGGARLAKYGVEYILNFELFEVDGVDFRTDAADAGADSFIRKDQGAVGTATNDFADEGNTYSLTISATEMQAKEVMAQFIDQSSTKVWLDRMLLIQTYGNASAQHAFDLDTASAVQSADNDTKISTLITGVDLNADAITAAKIADNAIATEHIATGAITADSIAADAIGASELAANAIGASEIATDAIGASELATDAIGSAELAATAATKIVDDWETQSQADPTGFHVNVLEVNGTAQTSNDNGADINSILTGTITNAQGADVATDVAAMIDVNNRIDVGSWLGTVVTLGNSAPDVNVASEDNIDFGATKKASINTEVDNALDTALPASPTLDSINDILDRQEESIVQGTISADAQTTTNIVSDISIVVNDQFNGRIITFRKDTTTANLRGQQTDITGSVAATNTFTITALTTAPANGDVFEIN